MSKIVLYHCADLHIRDSKHEEIIYAFTQMAQNIRNEPDGRVTVIIVGDIFETKIKVSAKDLLCFDHIINMLTDVNANIIIIPGNHDFEVKAMHDGQYINLISGVLANKKYKNVKHFPKSDVYVVKEHPYINFHVYSPMDNIIPDFNKVVKLDDFNYDNRRHIQKIALIHEMISESKLYTSAPVTKYRFKINDLICYDIAMAGDIHKQQFLSDCVAYSGSIIQQNMGEDVEHGYIRWSLNTDDAGDIVGTPVVLQLLNGTITIRTENNEIVPKPRGSIGYKKLIKNIKYVRYFHKNCEDRYVTYMISKIKDAYGRLDEVKNSNSIEIQETDTIDTNINLDSQIKILEEMLDDNELKLPVIELHKNMLTSIINDETDNTIKYPWRLNYLYWSNVFCYQEENYIDFTIIKKAVSLIGRNGVGKSSVLDTLIFALFNEKIRGYGSVILNNSKKDYFIQCGFDVVIGPNKIDNYVIERTGDSQHHKVRLIKNGADISGHILVETYKKLGLIIGDVDDFEHNNVAVQDRDSYVSKNGESIKYQLLKYLELDKFTKIAEKVTKSITKFNSELKLLKTAQAPPNNIEYWSIKLSEAEQKIAEAEKHVESGHALKDKYLLGMHKITGQIPEKEPPIMENISEEAYVKLQSDLTYLKNNTELLKDNELRKYDNDLKYLNEILAKYSNRVNLQNLQSSKNDQNDKSLQAVISLQDIKEFVNKCQISIQENEKNLVTQSAILVKYFGSNIRKRTTKNADDLKNVDISDIESCISAVNSLNVVINSSSAANIEEIKEPKIPLEELLKIKTNLEFHEKVKNISNGVFKFSDNCEYCITNKRKLTNTSDNTNDLTKTLTMIKEWDRYKQYIESKRYIDLNNQLDEKYDKIYFNLSNIKKIITDKINKLYSAVKLVVDNIKNEADTLIDTIDEKHESDISRLQMEIEKYKHIKQTQELRNNWIKNEENNIIKQKINLVNEKIKESTLTRKQTNEFMFECKKNITAHKKYAETNGKMTELTKQIAIYKVYKKCVDEKTGLPFKIATNFLNRLTINVNTILTDISYFNINFEVNEKGYILIKCFGDMLPATVYAMQLSGSQKTVLDLALRMALITNHPFLPNIIIIDEGFGVFDGPSLSLVKKFLSEITIPAIIISHIEELHSAAHTHIYLENSKIQFGPNPRKELAAIAPPITVAPDISSLRTETGKYYCELCNVHFSTTSGATKHLQTNKHRNKLSMSSTVVSTTLNTNSNSTSNTSEGYTSDDAM